MTQKHKHAEYIIAFANGEEVEWKYDGLDFAFDEWKPVDHLGILQAADLLLRMKPKTVITKGYKRFAFKDPTSGGWLVDTYTEGCAYSLTGGEVWIDKEWQYYTFEGKG